MINLIKKENLNKEELEKLDEYFYNHIDELLTLSNNVIINFIESCENIIGYSLSKRELRYELSNETIALSLIFDESELDSYLKNFELIQAFDVEDYELGHSLGDYYLEKNDKEKAMYYYGKTFKEGFNLCHENYFYALERYLDLLGDNSINLLKKLIKSSPRDEEYSLNFIDTYLLLIVRLEKYSDEYLHYINEGIKVAIPVVREHQKYSQNRTTFSDTDEERDLCELLALKMEYYVHKDDYINAYKIYKELTIEIGKSDCTRYYHARDLYYRQMLEKMSNTYPELKFFENIGHKKFRIQEKIDQLKLNQIITLEKENGMTFKFKIVNIYEKNDITIVPILPILNEGGRIYTKLSVENDEKYLTNSLNN